MSDETGPNPDIEPHGSMPERLGPCHLIRELGVGGMGRVFLGKLTEPRPHTPEGGHVALKVLHPALLTNPEVVRRFQREAELGAKVVHPCIVRTLETGRAESRIGTTYFLLLEYVEGKTLRELIDELGALPEPLVRGVAQQVATGITAVHDADVTHRDIKPGNILITPDHQVKVMDLGVAHLATEATRLTRSGCFVGTMQYASPEQLSEGKAGPRSDLYSLGVTLYEAATGIQPFSGDSFGSVLWRHLEYVPPRPREVDPRITAFFDSVIMKLLEKDPSDRFASASDLATVLEQGELCEWWRAVQADRARIEVGVPSNPITIARSSPFVGRGEELARLDSTFEDLLEGRGCAVLLDGEAGVGKTRLLDEFVSRVTARDVDLNVLYGSYPPEGYGAEPGALSVALLGHLGRVTLEPRLSACITNATRLIPAFAAHLAGRPHASDVAPLSPEALISLYREVAESMANRRPTIWIVEDVHFATADSCRIIEALGRQARKVSLMLVVTARPDSSNLSVLKNLSDSLYLSIDRLRTDDVIEILYRKIGRRSVAEELGPPLARRTDGNAFFLFETIQELEEDGVLDQLATAPNQYRTLDHLKVPVSIKELIEGRLADLTETQRTVLEVGAVQGYEFDPDLIRRVLAIKRLQVLQALATIERRARLVHADGLKFRFDHHQLQEVLYGSLPEGLREEYHALTAASHLERLREDTPMPALAGRDQVFLANHFFRGNQVTEGRPFAVPALRHLQAKSRNEALVHLADVIVDRVEDCDPGFVSDLRIMCSDALYSLGRSDDCLRAARRAEATALAAEDDLRLAAAKHRLGRQQIIAGNLAPARALMLEALALIDETAGQPMALAVLTDMGRILGLLGRFKEARDHLERQLSLARELGQGQAECQALAQLANLHLGLDETDLAEQRAVEHLRAAEQGEYRAEHAFALFNLAHVSVWRGDYSTAERRLQDQLSLSREIGHRSTETLAHMALSQVYLETGSVVEAARQAELGLDLADLAQLLPTVGYLKLRRADVDWALEEDSAVAGYQSALDHMRRVGTAQGIAEAGFALGRLQLLSGDEDAAQPLLNEACELVERLHLSVPGQLPAAYLALIDGRPCPRSESESEGRCSIQAELSLVRYQLWGDEVQLRRAGQLLLRMSAHLGGAAADSFWRSYPIARMFTSLGGQPAAGPLIQEDPDVD